MILKKGIVIVFLGLLLSTQFAIGRTHINLSTLRDFTTKVHSDTTKPAAPYKEFLNLSYGSHGNANLLDIYLPNNHSATTKMIIYIHGGSWSRGSKGQFPKPLINLLVAQQGYGVMTMNYRLVKDGANRFPSQLEDVKNALAFLTVKAGEYGYDNKEFALLGASAGAHLALLYAYGHDPKKQITTVIDLFGPTDLSDVTIRSNNGGADGSITRLLGDPNPKAQIALDASPMYHLTEKTGVPTIIFHGESDELVDVNQSKVLYQKLTSLGIPTQLELYPNEQHEISPKNMINVVAKIVVWLKKVYPAE